MIVSLQSFSKELDSDLKEGHFPINYPEYLVRSQIAVAERLEALTEAVKALNHSEVPGKTTKAPEPKHRAIRKTKGYSLGGLMRHD